MTVPCNYGVCHQPVEKPLEVLGSDKVVRPTAGESDVREVPTLAIGMETKDGVPSTSGPIGPLLFKGTLIQKLM